MNDLANYTDSMTITLSMLFPFIPIIVVGIVTFILGYDTRDDSDDDDDDDEKGIMQLSWSRA